MPKKELPKGQGIDALDSIVNVLRDQNEIIGKLTNEVGKIISQLQQKGGLEGFEKVEEKLSRVQNDVGNLSRFLAAAPHETKNFVATDTQGLPFDPPAPTMMNSPPVVVRCNRWDDFLVLASGASTLSFTFREVDKAFEIDALKDNQVLAYIGVLPEVKLLLKAYLSRQLEVSDELIFEGSLTKA
jgi:hypothetical protein